jgi:hypothetical protein
LLDKQRAFFRTHKTKPVEFRREQLLKLKTLMEQYQPKFLEALHKDLRRSNEVTLGVEMRRIMTGLDHTIEHFAEWAKNVDVSVICLCVFKCLILNFDYTIFVFVKTKFVQFCLKSFNYLLTN